MTYSIVARDEATGALGVAVQTHWFNVGGLVPWAEPGVGAVATQANVELAHGPRGLDLLRDGASARSAVDRLVAGDAQAGVRQLAIVDARGGTGVHTGAGCMAHAGHLEGSGFTAQANMMASGDVWPAIAEAYAGTSGPLARRMLDALDAGEAAGGDVRGRQSAALLVVPAAGERWERTVDLRVEDHPEPLVELRRLLELQDAYAEAGEGDRLTAEGSYDAAAGHYLRAAERAPDSQELAFWAGLALVTRGETTAGADALRRVIAAHEGWAVLLSRLTPEDAPGAPAARAELGLGTA